MGKKARNSVRKNWMRNAFCGQARRRAAIGLSVGERDEERWRERERKR